MRGLDRVWDRRGQCWDEAGPGERGEASLESMVVTLKEKGEIKAGNQDTCLPSLPPKRYHLLKKMPFIYPCN